MSSPVVAAAAAAAKGEDGSTTSSTWQSQKAHTDLLERYGRWLLSIPRDDVLVLQETPEYANFIQAFERLGHAHRRAITLSRSFMGAQLLLDDNDDNQNSTLNKPNDTIAKSPSSTHPMDIVHDNDSSSLTATSAIRMDTTTDTTETNDTAAAAIMTNRAVTRRRFSFLQHLAVDDVILRVLEFLECRSLTRTSATCSRFRELASRSAAQRISLFWQQQQPPSSSQEEDADATLGTYFLGHDYDIHTHNSFLVGHDHVVPTKRCWHLLRAREQMEGIFANEPPFVRVPMLGLPRRVLVTNAGDDDYNGIYFCTGTNANGYTFSKPRRRHPTSPSSHPPPPPQPQDNMNHAPPQHHANHNHNNANPVAAAEPRQPLNPNHPLNQNEGDHQLIRGGGMGERNGHATHNNNNGSHHSHMMSGRSPTTTPSGPLLRCIIAKRFSNETILWYMSKEVDVHREDTSHAVSVDLIESNQPQVFSFWSRLMVTGDASPEQCVYPSQTSILLHNTNNNNGLAWQSLTSTRTTHPPNVELLD